MKAKRWTPLALFCVLVAFLLVGLFRDPREVPSPLVGKPAPAFDVPPFVAELERFAPGSLKVKVWPLNVWTSWCAAYREEHSTLVAFARTQNVPLIGQEYKGTRPAALSFLTQHGDPYQLSAFDVEGRLGIDYGVYGVHETFVVDRHGIIRYKQTGPVTVEALQNTILPLIGTLNRS